MNHKKTFKQISDDFLNNNNIKSLVIKSKYGSGKTTYLKQLMEAQQYQRVLFITYRQTLARDIMRNFESLGFANYLDAYDNPKTWDSPKLIVQYDSLMKVRDKKYKIYDF